MNVRFGFTGASGTIIVSPDLYSFSLSLLPSLSMKIIVNPLGLIPAEPSVSSMTILQVSPHFFFGANIGFGAPFK